MWFVNIKLKLKCRIYTPLSDVFLIKHTKTSEFKQIWTRNNVRFPYPSNLVTQISETCEKVILYEIENGNWLTKKIFLDFLTIKIIRVLVDIHKNIYSKLDDHGYELVKKNIIYESCVLLRSESI